MLKNKAEWGPWLASIKRHVKGNPKWNKKMPHAVKLLSEKVNEKGQVDSNYEGMEQLIFEIYSFVANQIHLGFKLAQAAIITYENKAEMETRAEHPAELIHHLNLAFGINQIDITNLKSKLFSVRLQEDNPKIFIQEIQEVTAEIRNSGATVEDHELTQAYYDAIFNYNADILKTGSKNPFWNAFLANTREKYEEKGNIHLLYPSHYHFLKKIEEYWINFSYNSKKAEEPKIFMLNEKGNRICQKCKNSQYEAYNRIAKSHLTKDCRIDHENGEKPRSKRPRYEPDRTSQGVKEVVTAFLSSIQGGGKNKVTSPTYQNVPLNMHLQPRTMAPLIEPTLPPETVIQENEMYSSEEEFIKNYANYTRSEAAQDLFYFDSGASKTFVNCADIIHNYIALEEPIKIYVASQ